MTEVPSNTLDCVYGDSGNGKTLLAMCAVEWMLGQYGKDSVALCITADNTENLEPYEHAGVLKVWRISHWPNPFKHTAMACKGYWPNDVLDPKKGIQMREKGKHPLTIFEGFAAWGDVLMSDVVDGALGTFMGKGTRVGPGTRPGEDGISFKDDDFPVGGNTMTHYGLVQKELRARAWLSGQIPGHKLWTTHERKATEDNKPIFGPEVVGKAATKDVQRWFNFLIHAHTTLVKDKIRYLLFLKEHYDPKVAPDIPFKAVSRIPLPLLEASVQKQVLQDLAIHIPEFIDWTNDSTAWAKIMELRANLKTLSHSIIQRRLAALGGKDSV